MKKYTKEQLVFYLKQMQSKLRKTPTLKNMNSDAAYPSGSTYMKRFGAWNNALKAAGLKLNVKKEYAKEDLIENLKHLSMELGRTPKITDLNGRDWVASYATYIKHFGSWSNALRIAKIQKIKPSSLANYVKKK